MLIKFQAIAVGCLFSVLTFKYSFTSSFIIKTKVIANLLAIFLIFYIHYDDFFSLKSMFSGLAISVLTGYLIVTNIAPKKDFIFLFLNLRGLKIVGLLSYSIYIWQQLFTSQDKRLPFFMVTYPYNLGCIIAVSCLSYYLFERFFLRLKSRFSKVKAEQQTAVLPA